MVGTASGCSATLAGARQDRRVLHSPELVILLANRFQHSSVMMTFSNLFRAVIVFRVVLCYDFEAWATHHKKSELLGYIFELGKND